MVLSPQIPDDLCEWLKQSGFVNYCFISYPRVDPRIDDNLQEFAIRIRDRVAAELEHAGADNLVLHDDGHHLPEVFIDRSMPPGVEWPDHLRRNLGGSISLVAVLTPSYFKRRHEWCGKEWSAMSQLGNFRLPNTSIKPIIPVCYRDTHIPTDAGRPQKIDLFRLTTSSREYYREPEFTTAILEICHQIVEIARELHKNNCHADLKGFSFPDKSPFSVPLLGSSQGPPLRLE